MKKILIFIILFYVLIQFICCTSKDLKTNDVRSVKQGESVAMLKDKLGEPLYIEIYPDREEWYYRYYSGDYNMKFHVIIVNDKVHNFESY